MTAPAMSTPTTKVQAQDSQRKAPKEPKRRKLQVKGAKKGQERKNMVKSANKGIVIKEKPESNHVPTTELQTQAQKKAPKEPKRRKLQDSQKKAPKMPKRRKLQVKGAKKGQENQSMVRTNKGIVIKEEPESNHVIPAQDPQSDMKNGKGKNVDKRMDKLSFLSFVPRRKLPFMSNNDDDGKDHCLTGSESRRLEDALRGPLGYQAVFMPSPDQSPFWPAGATPPVLALSPRCSQS